MVGEPDLLGRHGFGLHDELRLLGSADRRHDPSGLLGVDRAIYLRADRLCLLGEALDEGRKIVDGLRLPQGQIVAESFPVDLAHPRVPALAELREGPSEGGAEPLGRERAVEPSVELGLRCGHTAIRARP